MTFSIIVSYLATTCDNLSHVRSNATPSLHHSTAAKVWFNWRTEDGRWLEGEGTKDMSGNVLFVLTDAAPAAGASIVVIVVMHALKMLQRPVAFYGYGKVVRIELVSGLFGFAAASLSKRGTTTVAATRFRARSGYQAGKSGQR